MSSPKNNNILGISAYYHDSAAALARRRRDRRGRARRALHAQEARRALPRARDSLLPGGSRNRPGRRRPRRLLRQAAGEVRAAARDLSELRAERYPFVHRRDAGLAQGEAVSEDHAAQGARGARRVQDKRDLPPLLFAEHHQSHAASAFYFSPFERAAVLVPRRRRRVGHDVRLARATARARAALGDRLPAFARVCCTRRSRTSRASRSTPASTSSWASRPTASRSTPT